MAAKKKARKKAPKKAPRKKAGGVNRDLQARRGVSETQKKARSSGGRPAFVPTPEMRAQVEAMVGYGLTHRQIASLIKNPQTRKGISVNTLAEHFRDELDVGAAKVQAKVVESLVKKAISDSHPQAATCAIFFCKTRLGWKETQVHEVEGTTGVLVAPAQVSPQEWIERQKKADADKKSPLDGE